MNFSVYFYWYFTNNRSVEKTETVVIYGAGAAGSKIAQEFSGTKYKVCYFVDDAKSLQKRSIDCKRVLSREQLKRKLLADKFDMLVIALPSVESIAIKQIYKVLETKKPQITMRLLVLLITISLLFVIRLRIPTFTWANARLLSACYSFTSEFGMGSGGSYKLSSPKLCFGLYIFL